MVFRHTPFLPDVFRPVSESSRHRVLEGALLVLDIDGVLIDANRSFHEAVARALRELAPATVWSDDHFQAFKRMGGFNNDFRLAAAALALSETDCTTGDWMPERPVLEALESRIQALEPLAQRHVQAHYAATKALERPWVDLQALQSVPAQLAILTGRPPEELDLAFEVLGFELPAVCDSAPHFRKPASGGMLLLQEQYGARTVVFVGDTPDDALCLRRSRCERPDVRWIFAGVGPDRDEFLDSRDLSAEDLPGLLPVLKDAHFWSDDA